MLTGSVQSTGGQEVQKSKHKKFEQKRKKKTQPWTFVCTLNSNGIKIRDIQYSYILFKVIWEIHTYIYIYSIMEVSASSEGRKVCGEADKVVEENKNRTMLVEVEVSGGA